ncbi:Serine--tRNA ligase, mitochondrial [Collichthys lucidus]|uniref:Serine--tRNA ligase, mitochondrial n=1 Tax=Collichthys lucidus TaxID=240159 RepID=A0A4U5V155_COLLU|nr:Serine--tRNA ligase, mitochondrial [Collichthys lucidus]
MASCMGRVLRVGGAAAAAAALTVLKPAARHCSRQRTSVFIPRRFSHGARSSLYEHVREGYSDKPELDMRGVCEETDKVIANVENRKGDLRGDDVRKIVCVWQELQTVRTEISGLEEQKRHIAETIKALVTKNDKKALASRPEYTQALQRGREIRNRLNQLYPKETELDQEHYGRALRLPNTSHPDVPVGDESQARVVELVGQKPEFDFKPRGHVELGEQLGLIRQRHLAHVSGHRSYYLRGTGARLQTALQNFALDTLQRRGFIPMVVPDMLKGAVFEGCGMPPNAHRSQVYSLDPARFPDLNLAGTGEVGVAGYFMDHAVNWADLPVRTVCSSTCYRAETDTGRETWGLYRVHHFNKISSGSNCTDYQSRRLNILYEREDGSLQYAHTVNATACAIPRTIIAILETHQTKEGTVRVPRALQPYLGLEVIEKPKYTPLKYIGPNQPNRPPRPAPKTR